MRIVGISYGTPDSVNTYSGVPFHLFNELKTRNLLVGLINADQKKIGDVLHGILDLRETIKSKSFRRNKYWRYLPENIKKLTKRVRNTQKQLAPHDTVIQFGVSGLPLPGKISIIHAEISIELAATSTLFANTYGFKKNSEKYLSKAIAGERFFLNQFDIVWTNTNWTAQSFIKEGVSPERIWVQPPACNMQDPGQINREWKDPRILFVGKVWNDKGGPLLINAFKHLKTAMPNASLTIIGCKPSIDEEGISVLGYINKNDPIEHQRLRKAYEEATIFCLPSYWESTGIVYMEAALYGLPIIMLKGQGREEIYPKNIAIQLESPDPSQLARVLIELSSNPSRIKQMGKEGRQYVLNNFTWNIVTNKLLKKIKTIRH